MTKYIIVNPTTGRAVQSWTFADRKHILYCTAPEWAMKHDSRDAADRTLAYLEKNFRSQDLTVLKVTFNTTITFG